MVLRLERLRLQEALNARDVAVARLEEACVSIREKTTALNNLQEEKRQLEQQLESDKENAHRIELPGSNTTGQPSQAMKLLDETFTSLTIGNGHGGRTEQEEGDSKVCA